MAISHPNKKLYSLIKELHTLQPWTQFYETDVFGVRIPETDTVYFISVMGSEGVFKGISAYRGGEALSAFWAFQADDNRQPEDIMVIPQIMITFDNEEHFEDQKSMASASGISFGNEWPVIHEYIPGFFPLLPKKQSLEHLEIILEQSLHVLKRAVNDPHLLDQELENPEVYLIREIIDGNWVDNIHAFQYKPEKYSCYYFQDSLDKILSRKKKPIVLQFDLRMYPYPVDDDDTYNDYYPFVALLANKKNEKMEGFELLRPLPNIKTMYESIPQLLIDMLSDLPFKPYRIEIRNYIISSLLGGFSEKTGIEIKEVVNMHLTDQFFDSFVEEAYN
jgi:hypothetical protein